MIESNDENQSIKLNCPVDTVCCLAVAKKFHRLIVFFFSSVLAKVVPRITKLCIKAVLSFLLVIVTFILSNENEKINRMLYRAQGLGRWKEFYLHRTM